MQSPAMGVSPRGSLTNGLDTPCAPIVLFTHDVSGEVVDDTAARDVFIRVWNRTLKMPVRKVFYRNAASHTTHLSFEADVPIWPGSNIITVHGRDEHGARASRTVVVLNRPQGMTGDR